MALSKTDATAHIISMASKGKSVEIQMQNSRHKKPKNYAMGYSGGRKGGFTPDAVIQYEQYSDFFTIEPELSRANSSELIYKWILFSMEAKKLKGTLYILVEKNKEVEFRHLLGWKQIDATLVSI